MASGCGGRQLAGVSLGDCLSLHVPEGAPAPLRLPLEGDEGIPEKHGASLQSREVPHVSRLCGHHAP